ncbi:MAG TPA: hypothetical protein VFV23_00925 [Verrucomicrobiae bacterium]|nr:hypothetical protein [Verrucomicrobiae bacterium]
MKFLRTSFESSILNFKLNSKIVAILLLILSGRVFAQESRQHASNFSSVEYFDPPYERQMHWRISGAEAQPLNAGQLLVKKLKIEEFSENGKLSLVVEAPDCLYDRLNLTASSPNHIQLRSGDGKFRVDGDGFLFHQTNSFLTISNNVKTVIEDAPVETVTPITK